MDEVCVGQATSLSLIAAKTLNKYRSGKADNYAGDDGESVDIGNQVGVIWYCGGVRSAYHKFAWWQVQGSMTPVVCAADLDKLRVFLSAPGRAALRRNMGVSLPLVIE